MSRHRAAWTIVLCAGILWQPAVAAPALPLATYVARLDAQGVAVIFSTDLIAADTPIPGSEVSIPALEKALAARGLALQRLERHWVIVTAPSSRADPRLYIASAGGAPLQDLTAYWRETRVPLLQDGNGGVRLDLPADAVVTIRATGHRPAVIRAGAGGELLLEPMRLLENIIVTGSRHRLAGQTVTGSVTTLNADDLAGTPSLGGDAMRATAQLPGMSSVGVSAKPYIRGGLQDEVLVRLDGVELLDAYHLSDFQSLFSAIDDRSVESVDVYTGGFPARYGNRMSGVMEVSTAQADAAPRTELGISLFSLLANTRNTVNEGKTSYQGAIRRGNLDQVIRRRKPDLGTPRYYDAFARIQHELADDTSVAAGLFFTRDDVSLKEQSETAARSSIDSRYGWGRLLLDRGRISSVSTVTYTWSQRRKSLSELDEEAPFGGFLDHQVDVWKAAARSDLSWRRADVLFEFGAEFEYANSRYDSTALVDRGPLGDLLSGRQFDGHDIHESVDGWSGGVYWAGDIPVGERLSVQPGIRWDFQSYDPNGSTRHVSPRLGVRFDATEVLTLRLDAGRFHQPEAIQELQVADGERTFSPPQSADHLVIGAHWLPSANWELRAELYEKRYRRTKRRFENVFDPFVLVPELEPDRVEIEPTHARARGVDVSLRRRFGERVSSLWTYSYMDAQDRLDETVCDGACSSAWVPRRWSQRHTAGAQLRWQGDVWMASAGLTWNSGWRGSELPDGLPAGVQVDLTTVLSEVELRDYLSFDVSLRRTWHIGRSQITGMLSITNLTNRDNVAGIEYDAEIEDGIVVIDRDPGNLMPLVPSIGVLISF